MLKVVLNVRLIAVIVSAAKMLEKGLIHIYDGDGTGKTTAAIGLAVRAKGAGLKVLVAQLFKEYSGELDSLKKLGIDLMRYSSKHPFFKKYSEEELKAEAEKCTEFIRSIFDKARDDKYDLIVIDEVGPALKYNFLKQEDLIELINSKPEQTELVMTGRGFPEKVKEQADYHTEMKMVKHPLQKGVKARKGVEY